MSIKSSYTKFAEQIVKDYKNKVTGNYQEYVVGSLPEKKIFAGKLMTEDKEDKYFSSKKNLNVKSIEFSINKDVLNKANIDILISGDFYYRSLPTLNQQRCKYTKQFNKHNNVNFDFEEIKSIYGTKKEQDYDFSKVKIENVFKKFSFFSKKNQFDLCRLRDENEIMISLKEDLSELKDSIIELEDSYIKINDKFGVEELSDEKNYKEFINLHCNTFDDNKSRPNWDFNLYLNKKKIDDNYLVSIKLINDTTDNNINTYKSNLVFDSTLYNSKIKVVLNEGEFNQIDLSYFQNDYKYNVNNYSLSNASSINFNKSENSLSTVNIPIYIQHRTKTYEDIKVPFSDLIEAPVETLKNLSKKMKKELKLWKEDYEKRKSSLVDKNKFLKEAQEQFLKEIDNFNDEINRFDYGIKLLETYNQLRKAFIFMNKTFKINAKNYDSWRLFQIVFIVIQIPDIAVSEFSETVIDKSQIDFVDLLYFPTGGGKTEAFLGVSVFTLFFDRIRGKNFGNSIMIKYPLRLLSVQQLDRLMKILVVAEEIRKKEKLTSGEEFSLGYYVGNKNTPNNLQKKELEKISSMNQEKLEKEYKIIDKCPQCGEKLTLKLIINDKSLLHVCKNNSCELEKLPLYIVDNEIYSKLPSVIIATVDKLAAIGYNKRFKKILGNVSYQCQKHGYYNNNICPICKEKLTKVDHSKASPSLFIQDEVHLLNESLGVYASHYEKFIDYFTSNLQDKKTKYIAATATVSGADTHLLHLYGKNKNLFPCKSPYKNKNFYSYRDERETSRIIIGHTSYGIGYIDTVVYALQYLREIIWKYKNNYNLVREINGLSDLDDNQINKMIEYYWLIIQYNNIKIDTNKVSRAINDPVNITLKEKGIKGYDSTKMTGDESFQEIRTILENIENSENIFNETDLINATSTISHGVDIDRANIIVFNGMPKHNSEYVQAYSRVGRKYTGIVVDIIRSTREKDMSYLKNFDNFHELEDILIENVPINTWAMNSINNTFPGILSGLLINYYISDYPGIYMMKELKELIIKDKENGSVIKEEIKKHILKIYKCLREDKSENLDSKYFKAVINKKVDTFYELLENKIFTDYMYIVSGLKNLDEIGAPMNSLRYTDKQINLGVE